MSDVEVRGGPSGYSPPPPTQPPPPESPTGALPPTGPYGPPRPPYRSWRRLVPRSLNARITAGVVGLVVVLVLAIGSVTYYALRSSLDARLDQQVAMTAAQNGSFFDDCLRNAQQQPNGDYYCNSGPQTQKEWVAAFGANGGSVASFSKAPFLNALTLSSSQVAAYRQDPRRTLTVEVDGMQLRAAGHETHDGLIVVTGLSTGEITRTMRQFVARELLIGSAAVLIAVLATTYGVGFSLRRLRRVTTTAQEVSAELSPEGAGLDRRVPDADPVTEVGQLANSFNTMLSAVETQFAARVESERRMRQFLADASHELRTPLTSIRGYAELARMQRAAGDGGGESDDNLDRIEFEGTRMSRLVEDLLLLARGDGDAGGRTPERQLVDVAGIADDAVAGARAAFPNRSFEVDVAADPHVIGDRDQLLRVVRNLVTNAAVHTQVERPILVRGFADDTAVTVQVVDGGPGLSPDDAAHVFERFWRADKARTRARGGSGLGLSIVASIVRAHGGTVRFDSTVVGGSTVTVRLPVAEHA